MYSVDLAGCQKRFGEFAARFLLFVGRCNGIKRTALMVSAVGIVTSSAPLWPVRAAAPAPPMMSSGATRAQESPVVANPAKPTAFKTNPVVANPAAASPTAGTGYASCAGAPGDQSLVHPVGADKAISPQIVQALRQARQVAQADPCLLMAIAWQESRFDPLARNRQSSARGLLQFTTTTWLTVVRDFGPRHGLGDLAASIKTSRDGSLKVASPQLRNAILALRDNPELEAVMAAERLGQQRHGLEQDIGRPLTAADLYVLYLLGPGGARTFLSGLAHKPNTPSVTVVGRVAKPNRGLFIHGGHALSLAETYARISTVLAEQTALRGAVFTNAS